MRKEEEQEEGREEERKIKRERRSYLERVDKTFWGRGVLETKTENELKHGPLFYSGMGCFSSMKTNSSKLCRETRPVLGGVLSLFPRNSSVNKAPLRTNSYENVYPQDNY